MRRTSEKARRQNRIIQRHNDGVCKGTALPGECWGGRVVHHLAQRSVRPDLVTDPGNLMVLCQHHHQWVHDHPEQAHELGFLRHSWEGT